MKDNEHGIGALELFMILLTITFVTLKLTRVINWKWIWVLSPTWLPISVVLILVVLAILLRRK